MNAQESQRKIVFAELGVAFKVGERVLCPNWEMIEEIKLRESTWKVKPQKKREDRLQK